MERNLINAAVAALLALSSSPAWSEQVIDEYVAVIGAEDRFNSRGAALPKVEQILAQDRANFHRFGIRHAGDTSDQFFSVQDNRAALPNMLVRGSLTTDAESAILRGTNARIKVEVLGQQGRANAIRVSVANETSPSPQEQPRQALGPADGSAPDVLRIVISSSQPTWLQLSEVVALDSTGKDNAVAGLAIASGSAYLGGNDGNSPAKAIDGIASAAYPDIFHSGSPSGSETLTIDFQSPVKLERLSVYGRPGAEARDVYDVKIYDSAGSEVFSATDQSANNTQNRADIKLPWSSAKPLEQGQGAGNAQVSNPPSFGTLPVLGSGSAAWQFSQDPHQWRGTALIGSNNGFDVAFGCTKPGADPVRYPGGGHVRPHEPGLYNLFVAPSAMGRDYGAPGARTFTLEFSIDGQPIGAAPVILLTPEMALATNIPSNHPFIEGLRTGSTLNVRDQASGASLSVPLSGSAAALDALAAFCATPLQSPVALNASPPAPEQPSTTDTGTVGAQTEDESAQPQTKPAAIDQDSSIASGEGIQCEKAPWRGSQHRIRCSNADGSAVESTKLREARAQYGLQLLGCNVPAITGNASDSPEAVSCFNEMFGLESSTLPANAIFALGAIAERTDKQEAIALLKQRGYELASEKPAATVAAVNLEMDTEPAVKATLNLPDPRDGEFYQGRGFYSSDFMVPLSSEEIFDLNKHHESVHSLVGGYTRWLLNHSPFMTPLFLEAPMERYSNAGDEIGQMWNREISCVRSPTYCDAPGSELFPQELLGALAAHSKIRVCEYDRRKQPGTLIDTRSRGVPGLVVPVHFWAEPVPVVLSGRTLKDFPTSQTGMHPFMVIGPYLDACPSNLGLAAEYVAGQFPELVPLASEAAPQIKTASNDVDPETEAVSSLDDPRQKLVRDLLGMSIAETKVNVFGGEIETGTALIVDMVSEGGPAYRAGYRSGDYLWVIGWTPVGTVADFVRELERRQDNGAVVITQAIPVGNSPERNTVLIPFAQDTPERFRKLTRDDESTVERAGWTTLVEDEYGISMNVYGDPWCGETVEAEYSQPLDANQVAYTNSDTFRAGYDAIQTQCPDVQKLYITSVSTTLDAEINVREVDFSADPPTSMKLGIDGMPPADTVSEAREIAAENAPLCDRLAAHPADANRRYGLEGVEFMLPDTLEEAINACIAEVGQNPDDPVTNFQLGRALFEAGLAEDAAGFFEIAAASGHGGAFDYLGQMHYDGNGVEQDFELGDSYFDQAMQAGFDPFAEPEKITFDTSGSAIASWFLEYNYDMDIKLMPSFANRTDINVGSEYNPTTLRALYHVAKNIGESCTDQGTIKSLIAELEKDGADTAHLEHAIFMYESYLPNIIPVMAQKVGVSASDINAPASETAFTLTSRYDCDSVQLRQFVLNVAELIAR